MTNERRIAEIGMALLLGAISFQLTSCSRTSAGAGKPTPPYVEVVTVEQRDILSKLGANDRTHAVAIAITLGMLRLELSSDDWTEWLRLPALLAPTATLLMLLMLMLMGRVL